MHACLLGAPARPGRSGLSVAVHASAPAAPQLPGGGGPSPASSGSSSNRRSADGRTRAVKTSYPPQDQALQLPTEAPTDVLYDAIVIGSGMGGLTTASQLTAKGARVLVLEK